MGEVDKGGRVGSLSCSSTEYAWGSELGWMDGWMETARPDRLWRSGVSSKEGREKKKPVQTKKKKKKEPRHWAGLGCPQETTGWNKYLWQAASVDELFLSPSCPVATCCVFSIASFAAASRAQFFTTMSVFHRRKGSPGEDDVEAGGREDHSGSTVAPPAGDNLPEYAALERYISTYREGSRSGDDNDKDRRDVKWWQFWKSSGPDVIDSGEPAKRVVPDAWLDTDIRTGIRINEVDERRKWAGWNELSAEKENLFAKFLGFFTGPILYGEL